ncbi:reverse transcriptase-like protein [Solibacillus silvestris]|uniref:reverse transcriptase-like protein n=1 Tax=Solibacillus silvestris TaxID=76853 RepID=UPI003F81BB4F
MKLMIEWQYITPAKQEITWRSEAMPAAHVYTIVEDLQKTGRLKSVVLTDEHESTWTFKELKKYLKELETEPSEVKVYFDGGFNREEKLAGLGVVIYYKQNGKNCRLRTNRLAEYLMSNNEAEYAALNLAIEQLEEMGVHHQTVAIFGDSQVVINEMNGEWAVTDTTLSAWADKIDAKLQRLGIRPQYEFIDRKLNAEADQLATQALQHIDIHADVDVQKGKG